MMNKLMNKQSFKLKWDSVFLHKEKLVEKPLLKMLYMAVVLTLLAFLYISGVGCVWRFLFHYPCPGCGITRACVALVHGDFKAAFEYNYMFISFTSNFAAKNNILENLGNGPYYILYLELLTFLALILWYFIIYIVSKLIVKY